MIRHRCPHCQTLLSHSDPFAGFTVKCQQCRRELDVPRESTLTAADLPARTERPGGEDHEELVDTFGSYFNCHVSRATPEPLTMGKRLGYGLLGVIIGLCTGMLACMLPLALYEVAVSGGWSTVQGEITSSGVEARVVRDSKGRERTEHSAAVKYTYQVGGQTYAGDRIGFGATQTFSMFAKDLAGQYRAGQKVDVYYDPANPKDAVLQRSILWATYLWGVAGLGLAFLMLRMCLACFTPTLESSNSRWLPWSHRFTWPDLPALIIVVLSLFPLVPMMLGL